MYDVSKLRKSPKRKKKKNNRKNSAAAEPAFVTAARQKREASKLRMEKPKGAKTEEEKVRNVPVTNGVKFEKLTLISYCFSHLNDWQTHMHAGAPAIVAVYILQISMPSVNMHFFTLPASQRRKSRKRT